MTDNEIIKALEICGADLDCEHCQFRGGQCVNKLINAALSLINRQKAEIERLKAEAQMADGYADALEERAKAEAIKEFAERLKDKCVGDGWFEIEDDSFIELIDTMVIEMVGDDNGCTSVFGEAGKPKGNHSE